MGVCVCVWVCVYVCVCVSVCHHMVGVVFVYVDMVYIIMGFYGYSFLCLVGCFSMIIWTPTVFECFICMCFVFLNLHLFSAIEHVSHGKAL